MHVTSASGMKTVSLAASKGIILHMNFYRKFPILDQQWKQYTEIHVVSSISVLSSLCDSYLKIEEILCL